MNVLGYAAEVQPLVEKLGGGFVAFIPDLKGCLSDGETEQEALANLEDAARCWLAAARELGVGIPTPRQMDQRLYA